MGDTIGGKMEFDVNAPLTTEDGTTMLVPAACAAAIISALSVVLLILRAPLLEVPPTSVEVTMETFTGRLPDRLYTPAVFAVGPSKKVGIAPVVAKDLRAVKAEAVAEG